MLFSSHLRRLVALVLAAALTLVSALPVTPVFSAVPMYPDGPPAVYAITNAKIVPVSGKSLEKGTIVFRDGIILAVGEKVTVPADAQIVEGTGLTVYPALINAYSRYGMPALADYPTGRGDSYPVSTVRSENTAVSLMKPDPGVAAALRKVGFGATLAAPYVGMFSGTSAVVSLHDDTNPANLTLRTPVAMQLAFFAPNTGGSYPSSLMGYVAVMRQAFAEARHFSSLLNDYNNNPTGKPRPVVSRAIASLIPVIEKKLPLMVTANSITEIQRMLRLSSEMGFRPILEGGGEIYGTIPQVEKAGVPVLLSASLPRAPRLSPGEEGPSTLQGLRNRALAPTNAAKLAAAGIPFALTTSGLENLAEFTTNVRKMIAAGLSEEEAVRAVTLAPARILGVDKQLGSLEPGKIANVLVVEGGSLFSGKASVKHLFIDGKKQTSEGGSDGSSPAPGGGARVSAAALDFVNQLPAGVSKDQAIQFLRQNPQQAAQFLPPGVTVEQAIAALEGNVEGGGAEGSRQRVEEVSAPPAVGDGLIPPLPPALAASFVLRGATVWTSGPQGKLDKADVYVKEGKIAGVGAGLSVPAGTLEIAVSGKHITPGMIDCHSHTAIERGVNEGSNTVTAECRIKDVIDPEDVDIYRQLAGGTTTANVLHGSANAIGGQNAVVKWRWGADADGLLLQGAPEGIKFALGENPTRSNGGIPTIGTRRYPATRMGVEQVIRTKFQEAKDYQARINAYKQGKVSAPPSPNLQLDAVVEVLEGKRLVHCHSYRADEILAMIRVADDFGFRIATFQHALEGYKVADEMAKHGVGGSTFSDWWAFKLEAQDAIPYNGALMAERGVLTSFNSDDSELARHLNHEAAKAVRYGGMKPEEALKLLTINPAKQLQIDKWVGSLENGKDADLVVWSGDPLSPLSICEKTFVDGKLYFDREADLKARPILEAEKKRLQVALNPQPQQPRRPNAPTGPGTPSPSASPSTTPPSGTPPPARVNGPRRSEPQTGPVTAIVGATVHPLSGPEIPNGVVLVQGGKIKAVGTAGTVTVPADAVTIDGTGKHLYPGMIDAQTTIGIREIGSRRETQDYLELGDFKPELRTAVVINPDSDVLKVTRSAGILNAVVAPGGGTISGMSALTQLDGWTWEEIAISPTVGLSVNFPSQGSRRFRATGHFCEETADGGGHDHADHDDHEGQEHEDLRGGGYVAVSSFNRREARYGMIPQSPLGGSRSGAGRPDTEAILRPLNDFLAEARAYRTARQAEGKADIPPVTRDPRLEAMLPVLEGKIGLLVRANRAADIRAAVAWCKKQGFRMVLVGGEEAVEVADLLVKEQIPVILGPVMSLPSTADAAYDEAYTLPARLAKAGVRFCISSNDSAYARRLPQHAAMAVAFGLPADEALKAITLYPAQILGVGDRLGSIEPGKEANLILTTGNPLEITTEIRSAWIAGQPVDLTNRQSRQYEHWRSRPRRGS